MCRINPDLLQWLPTNMNFDCGLKLEIFSLLTSFSWNDFSYSLLSMMSFFQKLAFLCGILSGVTWIMIILNITSILCCKMVWTCLMSNMRTPTMMMQMMLTQVSVRLTMPRRKSSKGISSWSVYSNLKSCKYQTLLQQLYLQCYHTMVWLLLSPGLWIESSKQ